MRCCHSHHLHTCRTSIWNPPSGRKLVLDTYHHRVGRVPSIQKIERLMVETENAKEFHQFFIIFACVIVLAPTLFLEGHHALWHATPKVVIGQLLLKELMHGVHDYRHNRGTKLRVACCSYRFILPKKTTSYTNFTCHFHVTIQFANTLFH